MFCLEVTLDCTFSLVYFNSSESGSPAMSFEQGQFILDLFKVIYENLASCLFLASTGHIDAKLIYKVDHVLFLYCSLKGNILMLLITINFSVHNR